MERLMAIRLSTCLRWAVVLWRNPAQTTLSYYLQNSNVMIQQFAPTANSVAAFNINGGLRGKMARHVLDCSRL